MKKIIFNIFLLISISMSSQSIDLVNPNKNIGVENWSIVNDDVMGGISKSTFSLSNENNLVFNGYLSLENNGGFASSRMRLDEKTVSGVKSFKIKLKGDGNIYKLRFRQSNRRVSYSSNFQSVDGKWVEVELPIENFKPTWRGYTYIDYPAMDLDKVNIMGIQISDKQEGSFNLEIEYIKGVY